MPTPIFLEIVSISLFQLFYSSFGLLKSKNVTLLLSPPWHDGVVSALVSLFLGVFSTISICFCQLSFCGSQLLLSTLAFLFLLLSPVFSYLTVDKTSPTKHRTPFFLLLCSAVSMSGVFLNLFLAVRLCQQLIPDRVASVTLLKLCLFAHFFFHFSFF